MLDSLSLLVLDCMIYLSAICYGMSHTLLLSTSMFDSHHAYLFNVNPSTLSFICFVPNTINSTFSFIYRLHSFFLIMSISTSLLSFFICKVYAPIFCMPTQDSHLDWFHFLSHASHIWDNRLHTMTHNLKLINILAILWIIWASSPITWNRMPSYKLLHNPLVHCLSQFALNKGYSLFGYLDNF